MSMPLSDAYLQRFSGIGRLYGQQALVHLAQAHFVVVGLGGVGSWTAEALARSGVAEISLIDLDDICVTNINRQVHALSSSIGQSKVQALTARLKDINPEIIVHGIEDFLDFDNIKVLIGPQHHVVIDAIDAVQVKAGLVAYCKARKIRIITVGSAGGKTDPTKISCTDLANTISDPMMSKVRYLLYKRYNFSKNEQRRFRVDAVYSIQQAVYPQPTGEVCQQKSAEMDGVRLDCTAGFGSSTMMAATMGFVAAEQAIKRYLQVC